MQLCFIYLDETYKKEENQKENQERNHVKKGVTSKKSASNSVQ